MSRALIPWPACTSELRPWRQSVRGGTREDRMLNEIRVTLPPRLADARLALDLATSARLEAAAREISILDESGRGDLAALGLLLLRSEAVASSKIERIEASTDDFARALHGFRANESATAMVAATRAIGSLVQAAGRGELTVAGICAAQAELVRDDPAERHTAGSLRNVQNWVEGSDYSPRNASLVPPPPELVARFMQDLVAFCNRDDLPTLVQAAIAHAQFETIHPFTDGNGRIGRALINCIIRRRGLTTRVVVPIASALVAERGRYFDALDSYRTGNLEPLLSLFTSASLLAARESRTTAERIAEFGADTWHSALVGRAGSTSRKVLRLLPANPVITAASAMEATGATSASVYSAIERLVRAGVLRPLTDRKRDQIWGAVAVLDELEDLGARIAAAARIG